MAGQTGPLLSVIAARRLARYRDALDILNGTQWGDFAPTAQEAPSYVNITGFREIDGFAWEDLSTFKEKSVQLSRHAVASAPNQPPLWDTAEGEPVWGTASGSLEGDWVYRPGSVSRSYESYNLSNSVPDMDWIGDRIDWGRNLTGRSGRMHLHMEGNKTTTAYEQLPRDQAPLSGGAIRHVKGALSVEDTHGSQSTWEMRLWGVHWPRQGVVLMTTTSEKFEGIFGLPHLTPGPDYFQSSKALLTQRLNNVLETKERNVYTDQTVPWSSEVQSSPQFLLSPAPQCELVLYAQVHPLDRDRLLLRGKDAKDNLDMARLIGAIEDELAAPQGAPVGHIPKLRMSAVIYSPDCAFFLESKGPPEFPPGEANHLEGVKAEVQTHRIKTWLLVFACVVFGQVFLLKNQMKETFTPSTMGRVSFGTVGAMVMVDGITFTASATWGVVGRCHVPADHGAHVCRVFIHDDWRQLPRQDLRSPVPREPPALGAVDQHRALARGATTRVRFPPPRPHHRQRPRRRPCCPPRHCASRRRCRSRHDRRRRRPPPAAPRSSHQQPPPRRDKTFRPSSGASSSRASSSASSRSPRRRGTRRRAPSTSTSCAFAYLSLWAPQIYRNAMRNCRRALTWSFVLGQSLLRITPIAYFWLKADNFLFAQTSPRAFAALAAWVWLQIVLLGAQDILGPRFAVPARWVPEAWDYQPRAARG